MEAVYQDLFLRSIKTTQYELFQREYHIDGGVGDILLRAKVVVNGYLSLKLNILIFIQRGERRVLDVGTIETR